ncbi:hypothetical protein ACMDCR_07585 [Labrys okinawensis]|uniref:hypothetical protein n=1 Tax=Labrys okinawensis TaxID=346911 RepID=UPI0039BD315E
MTMITHSKVVAFVATLAFVAISSVANAQGPYIVNGAPPAPRIAALMARANMPPGYYWWDSQTCAYGRGANPLPLGKYCPDEDPGNDPALRADSPLTLWDLMH